MRILPCKLYANEKQKDFESYFNYLIDNYLDTVTSFKFLDANYINRLRKICSSLKETINTYLNGFPGETYILFKSLMDDVKNDFLKLISIIYTYSQLKEVEIKMNYVDIEKSKIEDIKTIFNEVLEYSHDPQPIQYLYRICPTNKISPNLIYFTNHLKTINISIITDSVSLYILVYILVAHLKFVTKTAKNLNLRIFG